MSTSLRVTETKSRCYLPEEVVEEILLRLPPESLVECKRVCKAWYSLIRDTSFVNKHFRISISNNKTSPSIFLGWIQQELSLYDIFEAPYNRRFRNQILSLVTISNKDDGKGDCVPCVIERIELPPIPINGFEDYDAISRYFHCNGIICVARDMYPHTETIILCNPAHREIKLVSQSPRVPDFDLFGCGFGYDFRADDYKYVRILRSPKRVNDVSKAQIYSLRTDSWREIKIDFGVTFCLGPRRGVYLNGVYYWWSIYLGMDYGSILTFDMSKEEAKTLTLPDALMRRRSGCKSLAVWNESLALFFLCENILPLKSFEMWVLKMASDFVGSEGPASWIKHLTIILPGRIHAPVAFWKSDELLMETRDGVIVSYNIYTQKIRKLPLPGAVFPDKSQADFYLKTIVPVKKNMLTRR